MRVFWAKNVRLTHTVRFPVNLYQFGVFFGRKIFVDFSCFFSLIRADRSDHGPLVQVTEKISAKVA